MAAGFLEPLLDSPAARHALVDARTGAVIAGRVLPAFDSAARRRGLLDRNDLPAGDALVLAPCEAVHTFFMRFAIDIAFIARNGRIVAIRHAVKPWRIATAFRAFAVIELRAGSLRASDTREGDVLEVRSIGEGTEFATRVL